MGVHVIQSHSIHRHCDVKIARIAPWAEDLSLELRIIIMVGGALIVFMAREVPVKSLIVGVHKVYHYCLCTTGT
jgi:hypothetical protein